MEQTAHGIWTEDHPLRLLGVRWGHRMTVIQLENDRLLIHSPVPLMQSVRAEVERLGTPAVFVAPNYFHDLFWAPYFEAYPQAAFLAPPGMPLDGPFQPLSDHRDLLEDVEVMEVRGMPRVREHVLFHPGSKSLIVADLVFNLEPAPDLYGRMIQRLAGVHRNLGVSRLFHHFIANASAFSASLDEILRLGFDRIIVGHGSNVDAGGNAALRQACQARFPFDSVESPN